MGFQRELKVIPEALLHGPAEALAIWEVSKAFSSIVPGTSLGPLFPMFLIVYRTKGAEKDLEMSRGRRGMNMNEHKLKPLLRPTLVTAAIYLCTYCIHSDTT